MQYLLAVILSISAISNLSSQALAEHLGVQEESCQTYYGYMDGYYSLKALICEDRGAYKMNSSHHIYDLEVDENTDSQMEWTEWCGDDELVASIHLSKNAEEWHGSWHQSATETTYDIQLSKSKSRKKTVPYLRRYTSQIDKKEIFIDVNTVDQSISIAEANNRLATQNGVFRCVDDLCQTKTAKLSLGKVDSLVIKSDKKDALRISTFANGVKQKEIKAKSLYAIDMGTLAFSDFGSMLNATYPVLQEAKFDSWIKKNMAQWIQQTSKMLKKKYPLPITPSAEDRLAHQAHSWAEVWHWGERFVSGVIYEQLSWDGEVVSKPFHYDLKNEQALEIDNALGNNKAIVLTADGVYTTHFDRIYGVQNEKIAATQLSELAKSQSWIDEFLDQKIVKH